jgi:CysZ protein
MGVGEALKALKAAFGDVFSARLGGQAILCVAVALGLTFTAAWGAFSELLPMIPDAQGWLGVLLTTSEVLAGAGIILAAIVLAPTISMIMGGALFDAVAEKVEKAEGFPPGRAMKPHEGFWNGLKIGLPALVLNVVSLPLLFVPGVNFIWFLVLNGFLMGREYGALAALRRMSWKEARSWRRARPLSLFIIGLACSFLPFVAPLVGASAMTRLAAKR